jgi:hypothetical protein
MEPKREAKKLNKAFEIEIGYEVNGVVNTSEQLADKLIQLESYLGRPFLQMPEDEKQQLLKIIRK